MNSFLPCANQKLVELGWGKIALPITPGTKRPSWPNWSSQTVVYDETSPWADPKALDAKGYGAGLRMGLDIGDETGLVAVDIDTMNPTLAAQIVADVRAFGRFLGYVTRTGKAPKTMFLFRTKDLAPLKGRKINLGNGEQIELLHAGRQVVVAGIHPDTGKEYTLDTTPLGRWEFRPGSMTPVSTDDLETLWDTLTRKYHVVVPGSAVIAGTATKNELLAEIEAGVSLHDNMCRYTKKLVEDGWTSDEIKEHVREEVLPKVPRDAQRVHAMDGQELDRIVDGAMARYGNESRAKVLRDARASTPAGDFGGGGGLGEIEEDPFAPIDENGNVVGSTDPVMDSLVKTYGAKGKGAGVKTSRLTFDYTGWDVPASSLPLDRWIDEQKLLLRGAFMAVTGPGGVAKSTLILNMVLSLMSGNACYGNKVVDEKGWKDLKVLYVSADDSDTVVLKRAAAWLKWSGESGVGLLNRLGRACVGSGLSGWNMKTGVQDLEDEIDRMDADVVIIDPFLNVSGLQDENSSADMFAALGGIKDMLERKGVAGLLIHHERKGGSDGGKGGTAADRVRGSSALVGAMRGSWSATKMRDEDFQMAGLGGGVVIGEEWRYVMLETGKSNYSPHLDTKYFRLVSVDLGNAVVAGGRSDSYGVVELLQGVAPVSGVNLGASVVQTVLDKLGQMAQGKKWFRPGIKNNERSHKVFTGETGDPDFQGANRIADRDTLMRIIRELERAGNIERKIIPSSDTKYRNGEEDGYVVLNKTYVPTHEFQNSSQNVTPEDPFGPSET
jgi:hypothetical protein